MLLSRHCLLNLRRNSLLPNLSPPRAMNLRVPFSNYIPTELRLPLLYEDEHMLIVNKPANLRSVPGVDAHRMVHKIDVPRSQEWLNALKTLIGTSEDPEYNRLFTAMSEYSNVPRRLDKFTNFLRIRYKVTDGEFIQKMFNDIEAVDFKMHRMKPSDIPLDLVSAFDIAEHMTGGKMFIVHRLDMETSGAIVFAKNPQVAKELCRQFQDREVKKVYVALVEGRVDKALSEVTLPVGPDQSNKPMQKVDLVEGKSALTHVRLLDAADTPEEYTQIAALFPEIADRSMATSLVELRPHTGRMHQLRVHMAHLGHPMLGDTIYAFGRVREACERLCLHARCVSLTHPVTGVRIEVDTLAGDQSTRKRKAEGSPHSARDDQA